MLRKRYHLAQGQWLFRRDTPFTSLYQVCSGSLKTQRDTLSGALLVTGFFFPGDIVGIEAIGGTRFSDDALCVTDAVVCQFDYQRLLTLCSGRPGLNAWVISLIGAHLQRRENDLVRSRSLPADRRVLRFFVDLHDRLAVGQRSPKRIQQMPMRKQDVAHYLLMTPETLSRNLAQLRSRGLLHVDRDRFFLPNSSSARELTRL